MLKTYHGMLERSDGETLLTPEQKEYFAKRKLEKFGPVDSDKAFLNWLADRLVYIYGESPNVDFVNKLRCIAAATDPNQATRNIHQ